MAFFLLPAESLYTKRTENALNGEKMQHLLEQYGFTFAQKTFDKNRLGGSHGSNSQIVKGVFRLNPDFPEVAVKVFLTKDELFNFTTIATDLVALLDDLSEENQALEYEAKMYEKVSQIDELKNNIVKFVNYQKIPLHTVAFTLAEKSRFILDVGKIMPKGAEPAMCNLHMLATQFTPGKTLKAILIEHKLKKNPITADYILPIFFQIIWGIQVLQRNGIQHNDMHNANVFIADQLDKKTRIHRAANGDLFIMPPKSPVVLLFDWDWANSTTLENPNYNDDFYCQESGLCGILDERRDIFRSFYEFINNDMAIKALLPADATTFIDFVLSGPVGTAKLQVKSSTRPGFLCNKNKFGKCTPFPPNEPSEIHSCAELLAHDCFKKYKKASLNAVAEFKRRKSSRLSGI